MGYLIDKSWILIFLAGLNSTIGNLFLKKSSEMAVETFWFAIPLNIWFLFGLMFYGINVLLFAKALQTLDVSAAYPVLAGISFCLLAGASWFLFNEKLNFVRYIGILTIILGIYLLTKK